MRRTAGYEGDKEVPKCLTCGCMQAHLVMGEHNVVYEDIKRAAEENGRTVDETLEIVNKTAAIDRGDHPTSTALRQPDIGYRHGVVARLEIVVADITTLDVDAIVNAANPTLAGGGGVDGAIHRAAGPELAAAARRFAPCATGDAVMTPGFRLAAAHVIHAVGPIWSGGDQGEPALLANCYARSLELAGSAGLASIAFPAISTGIYGYPKDLGAAVAVGTVRARVVAWPSIQRVVFCCFSEGDAARYRAVMSR